MLKVSTAANNNNDIKKAPSRQFYLDWIKTITILIVFLFHGGRFFDSDDWHIKNATVSPVADFVLFLLKQWMMPLFFFVSGISTFYALEFKSSQRFLKDRVIRILVPLLFGIFILSPPQVYLERLTHHQFQGSLWSFLPHFFSGWYAFGGNFAWMGLHLWYLLLLFIFSILLMPLFLILKRSNSNQAGSPISFFVFAVLLLAIPGCLLPLDNIFLNRGFGGWGLIEHLVVFLAGYLCIKFNAHRTIVRYRFFFLLTTVVASSAISYMFLNRLLFEFGTIGYDLKMTLRSFVCFSWIFVIIGFAETFVNKSNSFLKYSTEGILPFYIIHQPIMLAVGLFIINEPVSIFIKYMLIIFISFLLIAMIYECFIKRIGVLRFLFGMSPKSKNK
ncbi:acyltransferase family protein [Mucilaginibacter agri]|uniref:Acyltransferase family protein n=1 Tax=Mucilaginibacter agri TaxID=2695265 RepID=A0A966DT74_9SPHI|nr:acyltransferase family protein [Mucilaginibacter agri]NCD69116.1 acyltransferase family protein [Mucilaginibacter agri]